MDTEVEVVRLPEPRATPSTIPQLQSVVAAGLTTIFAIAVATGISEDEATRLLAGEIEPTDEQRERLETILLEYKRCQIRQCSDHEAPTKVSEETLLSVLDSKAHFGLL